jgi:uncharacterized membrane protein (Fun14 family)
MNTHPITDAGSHTFISSSFLLADVGAPFLIGFAVGYFAKIALRVALFVGGAAVILLFITEYYGVSQINNQGLQHAAKTAADFAQHSGGLLVDRLSLITCKGVSAVAGFFTGLKIG